MNKLIVLIFFSSALAKKSYPALFSKISRDGVYSGKIVFQFQIDRQKTKVFAIPESGPLTPVPVYCVGKVSKGAYDNFPPEDIEILDDIFNEKNAEIAISMPSGSNWPEWYLQGNWKTVIVQGQINDKSRQSIKVLKIKKLKDEM